MPPLEGHQAGPAVVSPSIKYTYRFDDYLAAARARAWNGVFGRHTYWIRYVVWMGIAIAILSGLAIRDYLTANLLPDLRTIGLTLAGFVILLIFAWLLEMLYVRYAYRRLAIA